MGDLMHIGRLARLHLLKLRMAWCWRLVQICAIQRAHCLDVLVNFGERRTYGGLTMPARVENLQKLLGPDALQWRFWAHFRP